MDESQPYRWALAGIVEKPYVISEANMVGVPVYNSGQAYKLLQWRTVEPRVPFLGRFKIARAHNILRSGIVVYSPMDEYIACVAHNWAYILKEFRGMQLASEMACEFHLAYPKYMKLRNQFKTHLPYVPGGEAVIRKAYRLMIERGAIVDPTNEKTQVP